MIKLSKEITNLIGYYLRVNISNGDKYMSVNRIAMIGRIMKEIGEGIIARDANGKPG